MVVCLKVSEVNGKPQFRLRQSISLLKNPVTVSQSNCPTEGCRRLLQAAPVSADFSS